MRHRRGLGVLLATLASVGFAACSSNGSGVKTTSNTVDGATSTGGALGMGGATNAGDAMSMVDSPGAGGATTEDGGPSAGGATSVGGTMSTGGAPGAGGATNASGATSGGGTATGGAATGGASTGGIASTGGATSGGGTATGGAATSTGGTVVTGGTGASGGVVDGSTTSSIGGTTANGCTTCSIGLVCERCAPAACADPNWIEWPMPNSSWDVAEGAPNGESYTNNGDGTVTDTVTGLMWQKTVLATATYTWAQALAYCQTLTLAGNYDWRLPSRIELLSIVEVQALSGINGTYFPSTPANWYWSSSPMAGSPSNAWLVYFGYGDGLSYGHAVSNMFNVRCVR